MRFLFNISPFAISLINAITDRTIFLGMMTMRKSALILFSLSACFSSLSYAVNNNATRIVIAPTCLLSSVQNASLTHLATHDQYQLIKTNKKGIHALMKASHPHQAACGKFIDVTHDWQAVSHDISDKKQTNDFLINHFNQKHMALASHETIYKIKYQKEVNAALQLLNPQRMWNDLGFLTSYQDRYADSATGIEATQWVAKEVEDLAASYGRQDVTIYTIKTNGYEQPSVIAKIGNSNAPGIVVGAHVDTLSGQFSKKPGADDDGSGSVTVLELARTILSNDMHFNKPVYLMWYAAEEEGLVGSRNVVAEFQRKQIPIDAVLHFDMTGYDPQKQLKMWLMDDNVNPGLESFVGDLIKEYVHRSIGVTRCGYGCSDHASWNQKGIPAAIAAEASMAGSNPDMHSSRDTRDKLSLEHMTDYAKLALAFTIELAEPKA